jgi:transglutaminase-like putative cysteine protease
MKYRLTHTTRYCYQDYVAVCQNQAYLSPRNTATQACRHHRLNVRPAPVVQEARDDYFGNRVHYFAIQTPHQELTVTAISIIDVERHDSNPAFITSPPWESVRDSLPFVFDSEALEARMYVLHSPYIESNPELTEYALVSFTPGRPLLAAAQDLMARIYHEFTYDPHFTTLVTPLSEVLKHRRGVCQDFAHLMIACVRGLGLAARYVSGYLETLPPPGQVKLRGADASHAWLAVYSPGSGWIDFDPTNNQIPSQQHITTAWGRDYSDVTPLKGVIYGGGAHTLTVGVDVERLL